MDPPPIAYLFLSMDGLPLLVPVRSADALRSVRAVLMGDFYGHSGPVSPRTSYLLAALV